VTADLQKFEEPRLRDFVGRVEERLEATIDDTSETAGGERLRESSRHLTLAPAAKRARPRLTFHFGRLVELSVDRTVPLAAAAELVHTASLLHDDVVDAGTERRERETVNTRWNNVTAVLTGDALLCNALVELRDYTAAISDRAVDVVYEMSRSILHEVTARNRTDVSRDDWRHIAEGKTGALFGWCSAAPALETGREELADRLDTCGRRLGLAFQLADDLKDLTDFESGKDRYADIRNGNPSYPLVCAVDETPEIGEMLRAYWRAEADSDASDAAVVRPETIAERVHSTDAIFETRNRIEREVDRALVALGDQAERPGGERIADWARRLCAAV